MCFVCYPHVHCMHVVRTMYDEHFSMYTYACVFCVCVCVFVCVFVCVWALERASFASVFDGKKNPLTLVNHFHYIVRRALVSGRLFLIESGLHHFSRPHRNFCYMINARDEDATAIDSESVASSTEDQCDSYLKILFVRNRLSLSIKLWSMMALSVVSVLPIVSLSLA